MQDKILSLLGLASRAGRVAAGGFSAEEAVRGRGIAKQLYAHVCAWAKDLGCAFVTLNVWCGNDNAMRFYEKMGMTPRKIFMEIKL